MANPFIQNYLKDQNIKPYQTPQPQGVGFVNTANAQGGSVQQTTPSQQTAPSTGKYSKAIAQARSMGYSDAEINSYLKSVGKFSPDLNPVKQGGENFLSNLTGSTKFGQFIGQTAYKGTQSSRDLDSAIVGLQKSMAQMDQLISRGQQLGKDTSQLEQARMNMNYQLDESMYTQQQLQSGTTGKQALGSAIQTAASAMPFTGIVGKGLTKAGVPLGAKLTGISTKSGMGANALEGALGMTAYGVGKGIEQDKTVGETVASLPLYAAGGAIGGPIAGLGFKALGAVGKQVLPEAITKAGTKTAEILGMDVKQLQTKILGDITNITDIGASKNPNAFIKDMYGIGGDVTTSPVYKGVDSVYRRSMNPIEVPTYDTKGKIMTTKTFDPTTDGFVENSEALRQMKNQVFAEMSDGLHAANAKAFQQRKQDLLKELVSKKNSYLSESEKKAISQYIRDIETNVVTPSELNDYIYNILGKKVKTKFSSQADTLSANTAQDAKVIIEKNLDDYLKGFDDEGIKALKDEFEALTALQKLVNTKISKLEPSLSLSDLDFYGISNMISGGFFGNVAQFGKGLSFSGLKGLGKIFAGSERRLKGAFKGMDELYKKQGLDRTVTPLDVSAIKGRATTDIVPVGEVSPERTIGMRPPIMDEAGVPKPPIRQAEEAMKGNPQLQQGQGPYGYKNPEAISVTPQGQAGFDITAKEGIGNYQPLPKQIEDAISQLPPEQQEEGRRLMQQTLDLFGKKKIDSEGGFSKLMTLLGISGLGVGGTILGNAMQEPVQYTAKATEVSPTKKTSTQKDLRSGFINAENRGAQARGENLYEVIGVTGDIGKYQVSPDSLKAWDEPWLGKKYSIEQFKKDPKAQEEFMNQFHAVVDKYKLTPEEAAIVWHRGWGVLGFSEKTFEQKKKELMDSIKKFKNDPDPEKRKELADYVSNFQEGLML